MHPLAQKRLFLLDMDGTIYLDGDLFPETIPFLNMVKEKGGRYLYLTNNSSKGVDAYIQKLRGMGIDAIADDFLTSVDATIVDLKKHYTNEKIYVFGTDSFFSQLKASGLNVTQNRDEDVRVLVMGFDTELTFKKLEDVSKLLLLKKEIPYIATNPDYVCPTEFGSVPDCGSVCDMLYNVSGRRPLVIGKPEPLMPILAMDKWGYGKDETVVIGDRIYTDIKSGISAGTSTILVLSGETTREILEKSPEKPEYVMESARELLEILK